MELPDTCPRCQQINMVDFGNLETKLLSKLFRMEGYTCTNCASWKTVYYLDVQLENKFRKLISMKPTHPSFYYHFYKTVKRAEVVQELGRTIH